MYKALGYLRDFAELFQNLPPATPKIALMFDEGVHPRSPDELQEVVLLSSADRGILAKMLSDALASS